MYANILVDAFNYYLTQKEDNYKNTLKRVVGNIESVLLPHLDQGGHVYFLFDPLPAKNLNNTSYKRSSERTKISNYYKMHRELSREDIKGLILFREYLSNRDERFVTVWNNNCEADDLVHAILDTMVGQKVALVTKDSDWSRYLDDNTFVTDYKMKEPVTAGKYEEVHGYYPTVASVTFDKVLFGDRVDYIINVFDEMRLKYKQTVLWKLSQAFVQELGQTKESLESVVERIKKYTVQSLIQLQASGSKERPAEQALFRELLGSEKGIEHNFQQDILQNVELVRSRFKGHIQEFYHHSKIPDEAFCSLIDATIGLGKFKKKFQFGDM